MTVKCDFKADFLDSQIDFIKQSLNDHNAPTLSDMDELHSSFMDPGRELKKKIKSVMLTKRRPMMMMMICDCSINSKTFS